MPFAFETYTSNQAAAPPMLTTIINPATTVAARCGTKSFRFGFSGDRDPIVAARVEAAMSRAWTASSVLRTSLGGYGSVDIVPRRRLLLAGTYTRVRRSTSIACPHRGPKPAEIPARSSSIVGDDARARDPCWLSGAGASRPRSSGREHRPRGPA